MKRGKNTFQSEFDIEDKVYVVDSSVDGYEVVYAEVTSVEFSKDGYSYHLYTTADKEIFFAPADVVFATREAAEAKLKALNATQREYRKEWLRKQIEAHRALVADFERELKELEDVE